VKYVTVFVTSFRNQSLRWLRKVCCVITDGFVIPPTRWLVSIIVPLAISAWGIRKKSLVLSGAILGEYSLLLVIYLVNL
jgi:hypothetical protein